MLKGSYQDELDYFFKALNLSEVCERVVTKAAFCNARKKLKYETFIDLNREALDFFYENESTLTWNGYFLKAIDGSTARIPNTPEIIEHFGVLKSNKGDDCPLARVSQMYDVLNQVTVDAIINPYAESEQSLARKHFEFLTPKDLVLLDRNYPSYWMFNLILSKEANFCARLKNQHWTVVREFFNSGKKEEIITLKAPQASIEKCEELGLDTKPLKLRLIRVELETGECEVLITALLDTTEYPHEIFDDLYHQRWFVEEDYKVVKCCIEVENWSGKSELTVYQDFHAKVFSKNLTAMLSHSTKKKIKNNSKDLTYDYQLNITQALSKMKDTIVLLFNRTSDAVHDLLIKLKKIWLTTIEPIRPGRKFPRKHKPKKKFSFSYKPIR